MDTITLSNNAMTLTFDAERFCLRSVDNHLTAERYAADDAGFVLHTSCGRLSQEGAQVISHERGEGMLRVEFAAGALTVRVTWTLGAGNHFAEMALDAKADGPWQWRSVTAAQLTVGGAALSAYRHLRNVTCFGRTDRGGCFFGVEAPFDSSVLAGESLALGHSVSMKVAGGEALDAEPIYVGVYARGADEPEASDDLPRPSESEAMLAMVEEVLGPPRHGLVASVVGWHSEMERETYTDQSLEADLKALEAIAECGIDWLGESHPWGGQYKQLGRLVEVDDFQVEPRTRRFIERANELGVKLLLWSSMNHPHPWRRQQVGAFRPDKPQWIMTPGGMLHHETLRDGSVKETRNTEVNCVGNAPFFQWLTKLHLRVMEQGDYAGWVMDGHYIGLPHSARFDMPATCPSGEHDHLRGDADFACRRALRKLIAAVRRARPEVCIQQARPAMDHGVWNCRETDGLFTVFESASLDALPGVEGQSPHMIIADKVRTWARVRRHRHFLPHHRDLSLLFPMPLSEGYAQARAWSNDDLDYAMLSALSCSPKMMFYLPTRSGIDAEGRATIRKWLDWGRANERYLMVRDDLPAWPGKGVVDGSLHLVGGEGFAFLFNPNDTALPVDLPLNGAKAAQVFPEGGAFDGKVAARAAVLLHVNRS